MNDAEITHKLSLRICLMTKAKRLDKWFLYLLATQEINTS